jgi:SSS family solute:Na+ symporter
MLYVSAFDYTILAVYFLVGLAIGAVARRSIKTDLAFFLSGRRLPTWNTGRWSCVRRCEPRRARDPRHGGNGAQYGVATVHYYWIGADCCDKLVVAIELKHEGGVCRGRIGFLCDNKPASSW